MECEDERRASGVTTGYHDPKMRTAQELIEADIQAQRERREAATAGGVSQKVRWTDEIQFWPIVMTAEQAATMSAIESPIPLRERQVSAALKCLVEHRHHATDAELARKLVDAVLGEG